MPNKWVDYVKRWAKKNNMSYGCALGDPQLKIDYRKSSTTTKQERDMMGGEDRDASEEEIVEIIVPKKKKSTKKLEAKEREMMGSEDVRGKILQTTEKMKNVLNKTKLRIKLNELNKIPGGRADLREKMYIEMVESILKEPKKLPVKKAIEKAKAIEQAIENPKFEIEEDEIEEFLQEEKPKKGEVFIEVLDSEGLKRLFDKNYDPGDDILLPPFPKAPNGNLYDERDFDNLTTSLIIKSSAFKNYEPLAKFLQKKKLLKFTKYKAVKK